MRNLSVVVHAFFGPELASNLRGLLHYHFFLFLRIIYQDRMNISLNWFFLLSFVLELVSCSNALTNGVSSTITQPMNGVFALDFTTMGNVHVGISRWNGPSLMILNYALAQISAVSVQHDTIMTHMEEANYVSILLKRSGAKYRCIYGHSRRSVLYITVHDEVFTVVNHTNCELDIMNEHDADLLEMISSEPVHP